MTIGYVQAEWLDSIAPPPIFEGVILSERWNGFAQWATTRPVIEHLNALHESSPDAEHLPRFTFEGDTLVYTEPRGEPADYPEAVHHFKPFELDEDGDHLWEMPRLVWTVLGDYSARPPIGLGDAFTAYRMDGTVETLIVALTREE